MEADGNGGSAVETPATKRRLSRSPGTTGCRRRSLPSSAHHVALLGDTVRRVRLIRFGKVGLARVSRDSSKPYSLGKIFI